MGRALKGIRRAAGGKKGATAKQPPQGARTPCWSGFAAGLALGLMVAGLVYLNLAPEGEGEAPAAARSAPGASAEQEARFQFYTLLPEMEVVVPEPEPEPPAPEAATGEAPAPPPVAKVTRPGTYVLQAGSFRRRADAERRKASLALLGVRSTIQPVTLGDGETWFRVRIGPYTRLEELNEVRALLQEHGVDTLLVRLRERS